jgi:hypothetical protein
MVISAFIRHYRSIQSLHDFAVFGKSIVFFGSLFTAAAAGETPLASPDYRASSPIISQPQRFPDEPLRLPDQPEILIGPHNSNTGPSELFNSRISVGVMLHARMPNTHPMPDVLPIVTKYADRPERFAGPDRPNVQDEPGCGALSGSEDAAA